MMVLELVFFMDLFVDLLLSMKEIIVHFHELLFISMGFSICDIRSVSFNLMTKY